MTAVDFIQEIIDAFETRVAADSGTYESEAAQYSILSDIGKPAIESSTLLLTPNAFKTSKLYSIVPDDGSGDWEVVRATSATRVNEDGEIESVAANVPRIDYLNGEPVVLVEAQRTNLLLRSQEIDNAYWTKQFTTVDANATIAPNGTMTADLVYPNSTGNFRAIIRNLSGFGNTVPVTISFFAKANNIFFIRLRGLDNDGNSRVIFNLNDGSTSVFGSFTSANMVGVGNGWYYCTATGASDATGGVSSYLIVSDVGGNGVTANGTDGIYFWGLQLEDASNNTSYIPTVASTVTRNADVIDVSVPAGTGEIVTTFEDDSTDTESSPVATYQLPEGRIKSVIFNP